MIVRGATLAFGLLSATPAASTQTAPAPLPRVALQTNAGRIVVEVDTIHAPITAGNFLKYVDGHRLDGVRFYRAVKVAPRFGFVQFGIDGDPKRSLPPVAHEPTTRTGLHHVEGTLSVARLAPGTARGEFTISVGDQSPSFDAHPAEAGDNQGFAAFGRVVEGMDVVVGILDAPVDPLKDLRGAFRGQVPASPVAIVRARRIP